MEKKDVKTKAEVKERAGKGGRGWKEEGKRSQNKDGESSGRGNDAETKTK